MTTSINDKYELTLTVNNVTLTTSNTILENLVIYESVNQSLPTMDISLITDGNLVEVNRLEDGSKVDINLTIKQAGNETLKLETLLFSHEVLPINEGYHIKMHCFMSAPDFLESRIESVSGSSLEVFRLLAERARMDLISDGSIDKQVWLRPGIRGNIWLNQVINHTWSSPDSCWVYAITRNRELLRYNLTERASKSPTWSFRQKREDTEELSDNISTFSYPKFKSESGFLNSFFGYGRGLSTFDIEKGDRLSNSPKFFKKRVDYMNLNTSREVSQGDDSQGYSNLLNVHENYFNAYPQNMRLKSFYSVSVEFLSAQFRNVRLLDRVDLQLVNEGDIKKSQSTYAGNYFVEKIVTIVNPTEVVRRFHLIREGYNSREALNSK